MGVKITHPVSRELAEELLIEKTIETHRKAAKSIVSNMDNEAIERHLATKLDNFSIISNES
jgi:hypothetical protein